jgi:hypothetical protein
MDARGGLRRGWAGRRETLKAALLALPALFWAYAFVALAAGDGAAWVLAPGASQVVCASAFALAAVVLGLGAARTPRLENERNRR